MKAGGFKATDCIEIGLCRLRKELESGYNDAVNLSRIHTLVLSVLFCISFEAEAYAQSELSLVVVDAKANDPRWGAGLITKGIRREIEGKVGRLISNEEFRIAAATVSKKNKEKQNNRLVNACNALAGDYVLLTRVTKKGWLYTAHSILIHCATSEKHMDFRSGYYNVAKEAQDRGSRIGKKTLEKLATLIKSGRAQKGKVSTTEDTKPAPSANQPQKDDFQAPENDNSTAQAETSDTSTDESADDSEIIVATTEDSEEKAEVATSDDEASENEESSGEEESFGEDEFASEFDSDELGEEGTEDSEEQKGWRWDVRGWLGTQYVSFLDPDLAENKDRNFLKAGFRTTLSGQLNEDFRVRLLPLLEVDLTEQEIHRIIVEEAFMEYAFESVEFRLGWDSLTWGSASAIRIIDIINARDFSEGVTNAPKVGQPMFATRFLFGSHSLTLLYLTPFIPPQMPKIGSAFSPFPSPTNANPRARYGEKVLYGSDYEEWHPQTAARLGLIIDNFDFHLSYFYGYARFPFVHLPSETVVYPLVQHTSADIQYVRESLSIKLEIGHADYIETNRTRNPPLRLENGQQAAAIPFPGRRWTWNLGVERTFDNFLGGNSTFTPLVEFVGDSDSQWFTDDIPPDDISRFFENHLVTGFRWDFQNDSDSKLTFSDIIDLRNFNDQLLTLEYEQRLFRSLSLLLGGRLGLAEEGSKAEGNKQLTGLYTSIKLNY